MELRTKIVKSAELKKHNYKASVFWTKLYHVLN